MLRLSQILHQLRTKGDDEFEEISEPVPWLETARDIGQNIHGDHSWKPRMFKTHLWEPHCPKGGRYIVVFRHPYDVRPPSYTNNAAQANAKRKEVTTELL